MVYISWDEVLRMFSSFCEHPAKAPELRKTLAFWLLFIP